MNTTPHLTTAGSDKDPTKFAIDLMNNHLPSPPSETSSSSGGVLPSLVDRCQLATGIPPSARRSDRRASFLPHPSPPFSTHSSFPASGSTSHSPPSYDATTMPSFVDQNPPSDEEDSSSDEDVAGRPKPVKPAAFDRQGRLKPRPSYYYDADFDASMKSGKKSGRRGGNKGVPVFEPTIEEFEKEGGFYGYVQRIERYGMRAGIVKVIPPKEWVNDLPSTAASMKDIKLKEAISQHMVGSQGLYRVTNVAKTRIWNPSQWKSMAESTKWAGPDFVSEQKVERTERASWVPPRRTSRAKGKGREVAMVVEESVPVTIDCEHGKDECMNGRDEKATTSSSKLNRFTPDSASHDSSSFASSSSTVPSTVESTASHQTRGSISSPSTSTSKLAADPIVEPVSKKLRTTSLQRAESTDEEWAEFFNSFEECPYGMNKEDYTIEFMREVERRYWRTLTFGESPMYGADMLGSLFTSKTTSWNVANLGDLLPKLAPSSCQIPGVVSPYLYFGMWRATFAWHVEDADLYSINYIHFGAPKFWYSVPQDSSERFERVMEGLFPTDRTNCPQFLRHKSFLASPRVLANSGITLNRVVQLPGEFILTYPRGYHSGFNLGFNCAESVNFATERWLPIGRAAKACTCIGDSVNIDVDAWLSTAAAVESGIAPLYTSAASNKRSMTSHTSTLKPPKKKARVSAPIVPKPAPMVVKKPPTSSKRATASLGAVGFPCALCPDQSKVELVEIQGTGGNSKEALFAHRICVMFTPATYIEADETTGQDVVKGFPAIEKARWKLQCSLCQESHGIKIQCTNGKCPKACHTSCALLEYSGIFLDASYVEKGVRVSLLEEVDLKPVVASLLSREENVGEGLEDDDDVKITVLCRSHNPAYKQLQIERKGAELQERVNALVPRSRISIRLSAGTFEVTFLNPFESKPSVMVTFDDGVLAEIPSKSIVWPDSDAVKQQKEMFRVATEQLSAPIYVYEGDKVATQAYLKKGRRSIVTSTPISSSSSSILPLPSLPHQALPFPHLRSFPYVVASNGASSLSGSMTAYDVAQHYFETAHDSVYVAVAVAEPVDRGKDGVADSERASVE